MPTNIITKTCTPTANGPASPNHPQTDFLPLARPLISEEDLALVNRVLRSGQLVQGEYVEKLEQSFARYHGVAHAVAVANGTATLHLALLALGIGPGDEVIVPAFTYIATANVVELVGARCVFVDVDERTFNINPALVEEKITPRTRAIIPVHQFGLCCDAAAVCALAAKHGLYIIEDAACALGASTNGRHAGTFGVAASFSLHPRKNITAGEGGVLLTNNATLATAWRQLRNHGIEVTDGRADFVRVGFNYRLTDVAAALAWSQFQRLEKILAKRTALANSYLSLLSATPLCLPFVPAGFRHTWQTFHVLLPQGMDQQRTIAALKAQGIGANYGAQCIPIQTHYRKKYELDAVNLFPNAYRAYVQGLALPLFEGMPEADLARVANTLTLQC